MTNLKIAIIVGSTRPGRIGPLVGNWVRDNVASPGVDFELLDLQDYNLPLLEEPFAMGAGNYAGAEANAWAGKLDEFDGFIFVTAEYNHSIPAPLKNAIDYVKNEWANKSAAIVSYGSMGGVRAAEHLRQVLGELQMLSIFTAFTGLAEGTPELHPAAAKTQELAVLVEQLVDWGRALRGLREQSERIAA